MQGEGRREVSAAGGVQALREFPALMSLIFPEGSIILAGNPQIKPSVTAHVVSCRPGLCLAS